MLANISSPVFITLHNIRAQYKDRMNVVQIVARRTKISINEVVKDILKEDVSNLNVDLDYEFPLAETAMEILGCLNLCNRLSNVSVPSPIDTRQKICNDVNQEMTRIIETYPYSQDQNNVFLIKGKNSGKELTVSGAREYFKFIDLEKILLVINFNSAKDDGYTIIFTNDTLYKINPRLKTFNKIYYEEIRGLDINVLRVTIITKKKEFEFKNIDHYPFETFKEIMQQYKDNTHISD